MPDFGIFRGFNDKLFGDKLYAGQLPINLGLIGSQEVIDVDFLLDSFPSAAAAYSLRKLRSAYTGSAIRVRRASDNTELDIGFVLNQLDTSALTTFCSGTNGFVKTWYDQSGNARDATQTTAANQPQIVSSGSVILEGIKPTFTFDNTDGFVLSNEINLSDFTILWVSKRFDLGNNGVILSGFGDVNFMGDEIQLRGNPFLNNSGGNVISLSNSNTSASNLQTIYHLAYLNRRNTNQAVGQFNGSNNNYNNSINSANVNIQRISKFAGGFTPLDYVGNIQEIIIYPSDQSSNRTGIETNINNFYSIY
jgi:hypothetical protein